MRDRLQPAGAVHVGDRADRVHLHYPIAMVSLIHKTAKAQSAGITGRNEGRGPPGKPHWRR